MGLAPLPADPPCGGAGRRLHDGFLLRMLNPVVGPVAEGDDALQFLVSPNPEQRHIFLVGCTHPAGAEVQHLQGQHESFAPVARRYAALPTLGRHHGDVVVHVAESAVFGNQRRERFRLVGNQLDMHAALAVAMVDTLLYRFDFLRLDGLV